MVSGKYVYAGKKRCAKYQKFILIRCKDGTYKCIEDRGQKVIKEDETIEHWNPDTVKKTAAQMDISGLNLLLVEDNELNAEIAETLLSDEGANLTVAEDGLQAVRMFQEKPEGYFDAILMDIMMPVMDGITATKTIRSLKHPDAETIPIIAMTANPKMNS